MRQKFIAYDIDGTLLKVKSGYIRKLIKTLFEKYGVEKFVEDSTSFAGRTDFDIFNGLLKDNGLDHSLFYDIKASYTNLLNNTLLPEHIEPIPGVMESIQYFRTSEFPIGLLTGNFEESAYIKLNRGSLDSFFSVGSFGCNSSDRRKLAEKSLEDARATLGSSFLPKDLVVIGDTPHDITCAKHVGATAVAVTTGYFNREQLDEFEPDLILDSLGNTTDWFELT